jgi:hypothetical protein
MMLLPTCLRAKSAADIQRMHPDVMHVEGWIEDGFGHAVSIQGGTTVPASWVYNHVSAGPLLEFLALDQESVSVLARALMGLEWRE